MEPTEPRHTVQPDTARSPVVALPPVASSWEFDVFISYEKHDTRVAQDMAERLKRAGLKPWWDHTNMQYGREGWRKQVAQTIDVTGCVILIWSRSTAESGPVDGELSHAIERNKQIFIIRCDESPLRPRIGLSTDQIYLQWPPADAEWEKLILQIRRLVSTGAGPSAERAPSRPRPGGKAKALVITAMVLLTAGIVYWATTRFGHVEKPSEKWVLVKPPAKTGVDEQAPPLVPDPQAAMRDALAEKINQARVLFRRLEASSVARYLRSKVNAAEGLLTDAEQALADGKFQRADEQLAGASREIGRLLELAHTLSFTDGGLIVTVVVPKGDVAGMKRSARNQGLVILKGVWRDVAGQTLDPSVAEQAFQASEVDFGELLPNETRSVDVHYPKSFVPATL